MSERDELVDVIRENRTVWATNTEHREMEVKQADAILAAGYRKPHTITTAEERASIQPGTIAVDVDGNAWKRGTGSWVSTGGDTPALYDDMDITLTVLYEPTA